MDLLRSTRNGLVERLHRCPADRRLVVTYTLYAAVLAVLAGHLLVHTLSEPVLQATVGAAFFRSMSLRAAAVVALWTPPAVFFGLGPGFGTAGYGRRAAALALTLALLALPPLAMTDLLAAIPLRYLAAAGLCLGLTALASAGVTVMLQVLGRRLWTLAATWLLVLAQLLLPTRIEAEPGPPPLVTALSPLNAMAASRRPSAATRMGTRASTGTS